MISESRAAGAANETHVVHNAHVRCMDEGGSCGSALAWRDGRIVAVGELADVQRAVGDGAQVWDAQGCTVLPGFIDAHQHPCITALYGTGVRLTRPAVTNIETLQQCLANASANLQPGSWLVATEWDESLLDERRLPTRRELDDAVPDRPLFALDYSNHRALVNSRALELAGIDRHTPEPAGGRIVRGAKGIPTGLLIERGMSRAETLARRSLIAGNAEDILLRLGEHFRNLLSFGITRVVDAAVPADLAVLYREAQARKLIAMPTVLMPVSTVGYLETPWDVLETPVTGTQDGLLSIGPVKLVLDGAPACAMCLNWWQMAGVIVCTAALTLRHGSLDPIRATLSAQPQLGRQVRTGIRIYDQAEASRFVSSATAAGFAVASHAQGNEAISLALDAYQAAGAQLDRAGRPRLEHVLFADRELAKRMGDAGVAAVTQPGFVTLPALSMAPTIPRLRTLPVRWLLDAAVLVAGSSDFPVTQLDPLQGIRAAVERRAATGEQREPDQCIELDEALTMYTRTGAQVSGCLKDCGTLEVGKRADFVVLSDKLTAPEQLATMRVRATIVGGSLAYGQLHTATA